MMILGRKQQKTREGANRAGRVTVRALSTHLLAVSLALCVAGSAMADGEVTAIRGGDIYTITSGVIKSGTILIEDGKISQIGQNVALPKSTKVIDAKGKVVMPGLVAAAASMGGAGYSSRKIADSLDPYHYSVSLALASGVTTLFVYGQRPSDQEPVGGTNAVIKPTFGDLEGMLVKESVAENLNISNSQWLRRTNFMLKLREAQSYLQKLADYQQAQAKQRKGQPPRKPSGTDAYIRLLKREAPARLRASTADDILAALEIVDEFGIRIILEDAVEAWTVAEEIAKRDVAVVMTPRQKRRPNKEISRPSGSSLENAAILKKAGVKFAIIPTSPAFALWGIAGRDLMTLPVEAAFAVSGGLDEQTALEAITISAAEIIGAADRVGSLQVGKDADIIVLDGHPFHYSTFVELTFVNGKLMYDKKKSTYFSHIEHDGDLTDSIYGSGLSPMDPNRSPAAEGGLIPFDPNQ
ncbi:MAG: amidohydrolase family protein [Phycisphaerales bacterium]|nr:MAG: amidohydrolase family protein [Phycisphaerales bacterium]